MDTRVTGFRSNSEQFMHAVCLSLLNGMGLGLNACAKYFKFGIFLAIRPAAGTFDTEREKHNLASA